MTISNMSSYTHTPQDQYDFVRRMGELNDLLQDEISKDLFYTRIAFEANPNIDTLLNIGNASGSISKKIIEERMQWRERLNNLLCKGEKRLVLYGAGGYGENFSLFFERSGIEVSAFCDGNKYGGSYCGKPIISPDELIRCHDQYIVYIDAMSYYDEIFNHLIEAGFPFDQIFDFANDRSYATELASRAYSDFPDFFPLNSAIIDGGCYDGEDTVRFCKRYSGGYSRVIAFEPDPDNYRNICKRFEIERLPSISVENAALSNVSGELPFAARSNSGSFLISSDNVETNVAQQVTNEVKIRTVKIDDLAKNMKIGLVKMDIEGAEFDALHGAENTIIRDKPFLLVCVYHRKGDMLAIMDYLNSIVPNYRFWLRHYGDLDYDTVLYAAI